MKRRRRDGRGYTLVEMAVVVLLLGIIASFSIPAFIRIHRSLKLKGTVVNMANQLQLARQKAISTGAPQMVHLFPEGLDADFHIHNTGQNPSALWKFPSGVTYQWVSGVTLAFQTVIMQPNGRADRAGYVILRVDPGGLSDTVYVQRSGMVIVQ